MERRFVDNGCGFPVILNDVKMKYVRGVNTPDINYDDLHRIVFLALANKPMGLNMEQVRFLRHFSMTDDDVSECYDGLLSFEWESSGDDLNLVISGWHANSSSQ